MATTWLLLVTAAAVFVSMLVLVVVCLRCRTKGPLVSIRQADSEESTEFRVIHPPQLTIDRSSTHPPFNLLSPHSPSADPGNPWRPRSCTSTETESNPSYENPADGSDSIHVESDVEDTEYIIILPGDEAPLINQRRVSTPSSDVRHDYENIPNKTDAAPSNPSVCHSPTRLSAGGEEDREYLNVDPKLFQRPTPESSSQSDTDDDGGNYVNVCDGYQTDL